MPYFPIPPKAVPYKCRGCGIWHWPSGQEPGGNGMRLSCAVMHAPGTCCHYAEKKATQEEIDDAEG